MLGLYKLQLRALLFTYLFSISIESLLLGLHCHRKRSWLAVSPPADYSQQGSKHLCEIRTRHGGIAIFWKFSKFRDLDLLTF